MTCLTTRDAAKTSILSKQWRYKWVKRTSSDIWCILWQETEILQEFEANERTMKFLLFLYQVLLRHQGPITKFSLVIPELEGCSHIDHVINFLSNYGVEEFIFEISLGYKIPSFTIYTVETFKNFCLFDQSSFSKDLIDWSGWNCVTPNIDAEVLQSL